MSDVLRLPQGSPWLDALPTDICGRIALHLSHARQTDHLYYFATTSPRLRKAALISLSHTIYMQSDTDNQHWSNIFDPSITTFHIDTSANPTELKPWINFLLLPNLVRATVIAYTPVLTRATSSTNLRQLSVKLCRDGHLLDLLACLPRMNIVKLSLSCGKAHYKDTQSTHCLFNSPVCLDDPSAPAFENLPPLDALSLFCPYYQIGGLYDGPLDFALLGRLSPLQELEFNGDIPNPVPPQINLIPRTYSTGHSFNLNALLLSHSIAELHISMSLTVEHLQQFTMCPKMENFSVKVQAGVEQALPQVVAAMPFLHSLTVLWDEPIDDDSDEEMPDEHDEEEQEQVGVYVSAVEGALLRTVQASPSLKSISLFDVRLPIKELTSILRHLGPRLEVFETSFASQDEPLLLRIELILLALAKLNRNLLHVSCNDNIHPLPEFTAEQVERLRLVVKHAVQRIPALDEESLASNLQKYCR